MIFQESRQPLLSGNEAMQILLSIHILAGTIAVITAVLVVNVNIEPVWIWWVLPTALITPVIIWWKIKVMK
jgi:hypothetical protein